MNRSILSEVSHETPSRMDKRPFHSTGLRVAITLVQLNPAGGTAWKATSSARGMITRPEYRLADSSIPG